MKKNKKIHWSNLIIALLTTIPLCYLIYWENVINPRPIARFYEKLDSVRKITSISSYNKNYENLSEITEKEKLTKEKPTAENYINLGLTYYKAKRYFDCIYANKQALKIDPNNYVAYNNICCAYNELGMYGEAIKAGQKAIDLKPDFELAKNNLEISKQKQKELVQQITELSRKIESNPTADNYLILGNLHYNNADYKTAIKYYNEALKINPNYAMAYNNICSAYNLLEKWDEAIKYCEKALSIQPDLELAKNNLSIALKNKTLN